MVDPIGARAPVRRRREPARPLRDPVPRGGDQLHVLPAAPAGHVRALGGDRAEGLQVLGEAAARAITHDARLRGVGGALDAFLDQVGHLGDRLGGLLVQLPPSLRHDARTASTFFAMLRRRTGLPLACEPRHASWFEPGVDALWTRYRVARVAADPARLPAASAPGGDCSQWSYWRWHGSPRIYYSAYGKAALGALAGALRGRSRPGAPAWCILDNTAAGHAIPNAATLQAETE